MRDTDVLIIGGGICGTAVARELSRYDVNVTLVERDADVGWGQTKASYAIRHPGARWPPGSLAQQMIAQGNLLMDPLIKDLDIQFKRLGELILAFTREEVKSLEAIEKQGKHIKVPDTAIIGKDEIRRLEPNVNPAAIAALYLPTAGVFNPFDLLYAFFENARQNGVDMMMDTEVKGIAPEKAGFRVETTRGEIQAGYIVNAAGLFAEKIARMAGIEDFKITYDTKGSCLVLDTAMSNLVHHIVTGLSDSKSLLRFKLVTPTFHDKILLYTSLPEPAKGIEDRSVAKRIFDLTLRDAASLVPGVEFEKHIIAAFAGLTARNNRGDFIIEPSGKYPGFVHAALPPPGLTSSPAVARRVVEILERNGLVLRKKAGFNPRRTGAKSLQKVIPCGDR